MTLQQEVLASLPPGVAAWYGARLSDGADVALDLPTAREAPRRRPRGKSYFRLLSLLTIAVVLLAWWLATEWRLMKPVFLPPPAAIIDSFWRVSSDGFADATLA